MEWHLQLDVRKDMLSAKSAEQGFSREALPGSVDPLILAFEDKDERVRARAQQLIEQDWARKTEAEKERGAGEYTTGLAGYGGNRGTRHERQRTNREPRPVGPITHNQTKKGALVLIVRVVGDILNPVAT